MDAFLIHENQAWPPSLASNGIMHHTAKSGLMECLQSMVPQTECVPNVDVNIVDGVALVHILDPKKSFVTVKTFHDYSQLVFLPYVKHLLQDVARVDVVWDIYREESLKAQTQQSRGTGTQLRVANNTCIPVNWKHFLRVDANKNGLFQLLANAIQEYQPPQGKLVISTYGQNAVSCPMSDLSQLCCTHKEADTRLLFHASHAFYRGSSKIMIHATDTDVVVLAIAVSSVLQNCEIWVAFGHGSRLRHIPCHLIANELGDEASWGLLLMHAISGCDTESAFYGIGKKTA